MTPSEEILRLTKFWYEYVNGDHHKDRDCHFYITIDWAYGEKPRYLVEHHAYISDDINVLCNSYEEAEQELLDSIRDIIKKEKKWGERVLSDADGGWDHWQLSRAKAISNFNLYN